LKNLFHKFDEAGDYNLFKQPFPISMSEVAPRTEFQILPGVKAETFSTPHTSESLAIRITDIDKSVVYTSDTGYSEALAAFAAGADLLLMECSFYKNKPVKTHLELEDALKLAERARPRRVLLAHLYPDWDNIDLAAEAQRLWDGETIEARDGLRIDV
jgi:ribonuclease BN (tRNA processing enzyme)